MQALTPSIPLTHDSRTTELCEMMAIPHISVSDLGHLRDSSDINQLFDIIRDINSKEIDEHRIMLARIYLKLLNEIGLTPSKHLLHLSGEIALD